MAMTEIFFLSRTLPIHNQINIQLQLLSNLQQQPTVIRLGNKASVQFVTECGCHRISEGPSHFHFQDKEPIEIRYNEAIKWFKIESVSAEQSRSDAR